MILISFIKQNSHSANIKANKADGFQTGGLAVLLQLAGWRGNPATSKCSPILIITHTKLHFISFERG